VRSKAGRNQLTSCTEPKQKPEMLQNGEQPESIVSVREKERGLMVGRICERGRFELGVKELRSYG